MALTCKKKKGGANMFLVGLNSDISKSAPGLCTFIAEACEQSKTLHLHSSLITKRFSDPFDFPRPPCTVGRLMHCTEASS